MDGHNDLRKATLDKGQNGLPSAGYGALSENELGKRRTESALRLDAYDKSLAAIEERLLRIENSLVFRTVRLVGRILTDCISWFGTGLPISWHRRLSSHRSGSAKEEYSRWVKQQEADFLSGEWHREQSQRWVQRPLISIVMALSRPRQEWFEAAVVSVRRQSYENWQLCICDDGSGGEWVSERIRHLADEEPRIRIASASAASTGICASLNTASKLADGEWMGMLRQDDLLHPHCLHYIAEATQQRDTHVIYADEDRLDAMGQRVQPCLKPDWSPDLLTTCNYFGRTLFASRSRLDTVQDQTGAWFRSGYDAAELYDLALRLTDKSVGIRHVARVLYHSREPIDEQGTGPDRRAMESARLALTDAVGRRQIVGTVKAYIGEKKFVLKRQLLNHPLASIIVCSQDLRLCKRFLRYLSEHTGYDHIELVLVEHQSTAPRFPMDQLRSLWKDSLIHLPYDGPFNFAYMNNLASSFTKGEVFVFMNDDVEPLNSEWLLCLLTQVQRPEVGVVGAKLLFPSGRVQHAGVAMGMLDGAGHPGRHFGSSELFPWLHMTRNVSAVTGACLSTRRSVFQELGGFDTQFPLDYNDLDLCLRAASHGYRVIFEAEAVFCHRESSTRQPSNQYYERKIFYQRWLDQLGADPYMSPAFDSKTEEIRLAVAGGLK